MTLTFTEDSSSDFTAPPFDNSDPNIDAEFPCEECGAPLEYRGRGRKPTLCTAKNGGDPTCVAKRTGTRVSSSTRSKGSNEKLAKDAVAVLTSMHDFMAIAAVMTQLMGTAAAIQAGNEAFIPRAEAALANDPNLARKILKLGSTGGKAMLLGAYAAFIGSIVPVAVVEIRAQRASREE